jgi:hypothetical protein
MAGETFLVVELWIAVNGRLVGIVACQAGEPTRALPKTCASFQERGLMSDIPRKGKIQRRSSLRLEAMTGSTKDIQLRSGKAAGILDGGRRFFSQPLYSSISMARTRSMAHFTTNTQLGWFDAIVRSDTDGSC